MPESTSSASPRRRPSRRWWVAAGSGCPPVEIHVPLAPARRSFVPTNNGAGAPKDARAVSGPPAGAGSAVVVLADPDARDEHVARTVVAPVESPGAGREVGRARGPGHVCALPVRPDGNRDAGIVAGSAEERRELELLVRQLQRRQERVPGAVVARVVRVTRGREVGRGRRSRDVRELALLVDGDSAAGVARGSAEERRVGQRREPVEGGDEGVTVAVVRPSWACRVVG